MTGNETAAELLYPCPTGYDLGYAITQMSYNASLQELLTVAGSFQNATVRLPKSVAIDGS